MWTWSNAYLFGSSQSLCAAATGKLPTLTLKELCILEFFLILWSSLHEYCIRLQLQLALTLSLSRPDRIVPIAERFGMDANAVLDNVRRSFIFLHFCLFRIEKSDWWEFVVFYAGEKIIYARAYTYEHQYNLLLGLAAKMSEEPFRLLVSSYYIEFLPI